MKLATTSYQLTLFLMLEQIKIAIINSNIVDLQNIKHITLRMNQIFWSPNALEPEGELLFEYGDNEIFAITRIANGKQNVSYPLRDIILYGKYYRDGHWTWAKPISVEWFQHFLDDLTVPTESVKMISYIKEVIFTDKLISNEVKCSFKQLLKEKKPAEFLYKALIDVALTANIYTSERSQEIIQSRNNNNPPKKCG